MRTFLKENGLSVVLLLVTCACIAGQLITGYRVDQRQRRDRGRPVVAFSDHARSPHALEAFAENWESEFLQMAAFVVLTIALKQKGSSESKKFDGHDEADEDPRLHAGATNWPTRRGGWVLRIYEDSLTIALLLLFVLSFSLHAIAGARLQSEEDLLNGGLPVGTLQFMGSASFWFESFQNWQSEFLSVATLVVLSVFLRQRGSAQSKPVAAPHSETGA